MDSSEYSNHWRIGDIVVTSVVEQSFDWSAPGFLFPDATNEVVQRHRSLVPDYADSEGNINGSVQALVIDQAERRILVDPCVGNGRSQFLPNWHMQEFDADPWPPEAVEDSQIALLLLSTRALGLIQDTRQSALSPRWEQHLGLVHCSIMKSTLPVLAHND
jgi:hypothetical protein